MLKDIPIDVCAAENIRGHYGLFVFLRLLGSHVLLDVEVDEEDTEGDQENRHDVEWMRRILAVFAKKGITHVKEY